jgi:hypothetical protein
VSCGLKKKKEKKRKEKKKVREIKVDPEEIVPGRRKKQNIQPSFGIPSFKLKKTTIYS